MAVVRLHSLAQCEIERRRPSFLERLFGARFTTRPFERLGQARAERIVAVGYPAALKLPAGQRRASRYEAYLEAIVQRDVREVARIASLDVLPRLLAAAVADICFPASSATSPHSVAPANHNQVLRSGGGWMQRVLSR